MADIRVDIYLFKVSMITPENWFFRMFYLTHFEQVNARYECMSFPSHQFFNYVETSLLVFIDEALERNP